MNTLYIAVDISKDGARNMRDFDTLAAANAYARTIWDHLTEREKEGREVFVAKVMEGDMRAATDVAEDCFDSSNEARQ